VQEFFDPLRSYCTRICHWPVVRCVAGMAQYHYFNLIQSLSKHYGFDIETPWTELPSNVRHVLLHGSGTEAIEFSYREEAGRSSRKRHAFEGILPNLTRRYRETESAMGARGAGALSGGAPVPGVPGHAPESRGALRVRRGRSLPNLPL